MIPTKIANTQENMHIYQVIRYYKYKQTCLLTNTNIKHSQLTTKDPTALYKSLSERQGWGYHMFW